MDNTLILMRGVPSSGKSTLARRLCGRLGGKIFSADDLLIADEVYTWSPELVHAAHRICEKLVETAMHRKERIIIVDNTNLKPSYARPYVILARKHNYQILVREPNTPWKHDLQELFNRGTHGLTLEVLERMLTTWLNVPITAFKEILEIHDPGSNRTQPTSENAEKQATCQSSDETM